MRTIRNEHGNKTIRHDDAVGQLEMSALYNKEATGWPRFLVEKDADATRSSAS